MTEHNLIKRRHLLGVGTASIITLAGCIGGSDDGNENGDESSSDDGDDTDDEEHAQAGVSVSDGEAQVSSIADGTAGVFCEDADVEEPGDIVDGENGATSVGETFPCEGSVYGITEGGNVNQIT